MEARGISAPHFAEKSAIAVAGALLLAGAALLHGLYWQDYGSDYGRHPIPTVFCLSFYGLTAFWAGQPEFHALLGALRRPLCGLLFLAHKNPTRLARRALKLMVLGLFYLNMAFLPFAGWLQQSRFIMREPVPVDGNGLNPLCKIPA